MRKTRRSAGLVRGAGRSHPPITLHDLDIYFSERGEEDRPDFQHIGITYNINHGVQILGQRGGLPPPYSRAREEGARARQEEGAVQGARRGPPPPYRSNEHLAQPLLEEEDGNNNGDINGNSDMADNNAPVEEGRTAEGERRREEGTPPPRYPGPRRREYSSTDSDTE